MDHSSIKSLFIVDGALDRPLLHSQGIPLLKRLCQSGNQCFILSFEKSNDSISKPLAKELSDSGIVWSPVVGSDQRGSVILRGLKQAWRLCRQEGIKVIHCRSYRPAVIGSILKMMLGCGYIFDMRGFLIDEQIVLGRWKPGTIKYHLARMVERWLLLNADEIVTLTDKFRDLVLALPYISSQNSKNKISVIPNCADIQRFQYLPEERQKARQELGWENRFVLVFIGEVRRWEAFEQILDLYLELKRLDERVFLALYLYGDVNLVKELLSSKSLSSENYALGTLMPGEIPQILNAADLGVIFRRENKFIQWIASPIKFAEYLACGLPVVVSPDMGDTANILKKYRAGFVIDPQDSQQLCDGAREILHLCLNDFDIRSRCRQAAEKELNLDTAVAQYAQAYERVGNHSARRKLC
jgi:glycosyltransferase involved in cell wall biosynthesis